MACSPQIDNTDRDQQQPNVKGQRGQDHPDGFSDGDLRGKQVVDGGAGGHLNLPYFIELQRHRMIETSGVIEKEQGNGFYLVTLEQPAGHQCLCRAAGKLTKFRIKLLAGDKVLVEISPYDLTRGRITYRERNAGAPGGRPGGNRPGGPRRR